MLVREEAFAIIRRIFKLHGAREIGQSVTQSLSQSVGRRLIGVPVVLGCGGGVGVC
jgi:hypothetical protein